MQNENLINYIYIPLDIFVKMPHNEIRELEAWLYFLGCDNPVHIQKIVTKYPFFAELYRDIIYFRYHPKELMFMYSEALAIMDKNTVNLMIDTMRETIEEKDSIIAEKDSALADAQDTNAKLQAEVERLKAILKNQS